MPMTWLAVVESINQSEGTVANCINQWNGLWLTVNNNWDPQKGLLLTTERNMDNYGDLQKELPKTMEIHGRDHEQQ